MQLVILNIILIVLVPVCHSNLNTTELPTVTCRKCSPCWNVFGKNYGSCSNEGYDINPFNDTQPVCIDTLILLIIMFLSFIILLPVSLYFLYVWIKRCRNIDAKYVVNGRIVG